MQHFTRRFTHRAQKTIRARYLTMAPVEIMGHIAGILTTFSASPQLVYSYRSGDVKSFDLKFLLMLASGLFIWGIYGIAIGSLPVVVFNFIGCMLWLPIIWMKFKELYL
jgi:MtN3 and saliva related transmembrane protein